MDNDLIRSISTIAATVPPDIVDRLAAQIEEISSPPTLAQQAHCLSFVVQPVVRAQVQIMLSTWQLTDQPPSGPGLAFALRAAALTAEEQRRSSSTSLIWTGPRPSGPALRRTDQALYELIDRAQETLLVVSFAVYDIPLVREALVRAANRGVRIKICIESPDESQGKVTFDGIKALGPAVARRASVYIWPLVQRPRNEQGRFGALHAKCAVADGKQLLISSANLTAHALTLNMELGVLIDDVKLAAGVQQLFQRMIEEKTLVGV